MGLKRKRTELCEYDVVWRKIREATLRDGNPHLWWNQFKENQFIFRPLKSTVS